MTVLLAFATLYDTLVPIILCLGFAGGIVSIESTPPLRWGISAFVLALGLILWRYGQWLPNRNGLTPREWQQLRAVATKKIAHHRERKHKLGLPFTEAMKRYQALKRVAKPKSDVKKYAFKKEQYAYFSQLLIVQPVTEGEITTSIYKTVSAYLQHHTDCLSELFERIADPDDLRSAELDAEWTKTLTERLLKSCALNHFRTLVAQHESLNKRLPRLKFILYRDGFIEGAKSFVERVIGKGVTDSRDDDLRFHRQFEEDIQRYLAIWEEMYQTLVNVILPEHRRIYEKASETSVACAMNVYRYLFSQQRPLRPHLQTLRRQVKPHDRAMI